MISCFSVSKWVWFWRVPQVWQSWRHGCGHKPRTSRVCGHASVGTILEKENEGKSSPTSCVAGTPLCSLQEMHGVCMSWKSNWHIYFNWFQSKFKAHNTSNEILFAKPALPVWVTLPSLCFILFLWGQASLAPSTHSESGRIWFLCVPFFMQYSTPFISKSHHFAQFWASFIPTPNGRIKIHSVLSKVLTYFSTIYLSPSQLSPVFTVLFLFANWECLE